MGLVPQAMRARRPVREDTRTGPDAGFLETAGASFRVTVDEQSLPQKYRLTEGYGELVAGLVKRGVDPATLTRREDLSTMTSRIGERTELDFEKVWALADQYRARGDAAFAKLPKTQAEYEQGVLGRDGRRADDQATVGRGGIVGQLAGGAAGSMVDPVNLGLSLAVPGGFGGSMLKRFATDIAANMVVEAVQQPALAENKARLGEDLTLGDAVLNVGTAGLAAGAIRGGIEIGGAAGRRAGSALADAREAAIAKVWDRLPQAVRDKWGSAAKVGDEGLADVVEATIGRDRLAPDEAAAIAILRRDAEIARGNPFVADGAGTTAHADGMAAAMTRILADVPSATTTAPRPAQVAVLRRGTTLSRGGAGGAGVDTGIVGFFEAKGYPTAQARGIAAGIAAESRNAHGIINPDSGAYGLGQWLGARKKELFRRYGPQPTREQQLEYLHWELGGGDHGGRAVRGAADEAGALDAYIRRFMRPAKGAETDGDLARGMAALGRAGEAPPSDVGAARAGPAPDEIGALDAERARLDAESAKLGNAAPGADPVAALTDALPSIDAPGVDTAAIRDPVPALPPPAPQLRPEMMAAAGIAPAFGGRTLPVRKRPSDIVEFLADRGGLRDNEGHDLRVGRGMGDVKPFRTGRLIRNAGMGIDEAGEYLHEAGFFLERPTTAETLELLERAVNGGEKIYPLQDAGDMATHRAQQYQAKYGDDELAERRWAVRDELADYADLLDDEMVDDIVMERVDGRDGRSSFEIMNDLVMDRYHNLAERANEVAGDQSHDWRQYVDDDPIDESRFEPDDGHTRAPDADGSGPAAAGPYARGGGAAGAAERAAGEPDDVASGDAVAAFADPDTAAAIAQADSFEHDLRMAAEAGDGAAHAAIAAIDAERADIDLVRACLKPGPVGGEA